MFEEPGDGSPGQISYVSPIYKKVWGRSPESLLENNQSWLEAIHPEDQERVRQALPKLPKGDFNLE